MPYRFNEVGSSIKLRIGAENWAKIMAIFPVPERKIRTSGNAIRIPSLPSEDEDISDNSFEQNEDHSPDDAPSSSISFNSVPSSKIPKSTSLNIASALGTFFFPYSFFSSFPLSYPPSLFIPLTVSHILQINPFPLYFLP